MANIKNITGQPILLEKDPETRVETILDAHSTLEVSDEKVEEYLQIPNVVLTDE